MAVGIERGVRTHVREREKESDPESERVRA